MRVGEISTERLILRHSDQDRDGWKLLMMLEEEGDFRIFTGVEYSEKYRDDFLDYFEVTHGNRCYYSLFPKEDPGKFIWICGISYKFRPAIRVLEKLGFIKSDEGPATIMSEFVDFEDEESCLELISEYKLENKNCVTD